MNPLVSVCIITYNSSSTIIETLDSIKKQDYHNLELIISDDCSKDDTLTKVSGWLKENGSRFVFSKLISAEKNHGTAVNLNTAIKNSNGEWIKILAGDDLLTENCISVFLQNTETRPDIDFFVSRVKVFSNDCNFSLDKKFNTERIQTFYDYNSKLQHKTKKTKMRIAAYRLIYPGPAWFFSRRLYDSLGGLDESYSMLDETPFTFYAVQSGNEIVPVDDILVKYRVSSSSASRTAFSPIRRIYMEQDQRFFYEKQLPVLRKNWMLLEIWDMKVHFSLLKKQLNKAEKTGILDSNIMKLQKLLSPKSFMDKVKKILGIE